MSERKRASGDEPESEREVALTYEEKDGKATLTSRTVFESIAMKAEHVGGGFEQGVGSGFDRLEALARKLARSGTGRTLVVS